MLDLPFRELMTLVKDAKSGEDAIRIIIKECAGCRFCIPKKLSTLEFSSTEEQREKFRDMLFKEGKTPAEIAEEYGLSTKRVRDIINGK